MNKKNPLSQAETRAECEPWRAATKIVPQTTQPVKLDCYVNLLTLHPNHRLGNVQAYAKIQLGEHLVISAIRILQRPGSPPSILYPNHLSDGRLHPVVEVIDPKLDDVIAKTILNAYAGT